MALVMDVGLGPGHIVLGGDLASPKKGAQPPIFGPRLLWANGCMYQVTTWYGCGPQLGDIVLDRDPASPPLKGHSPQFSANVRCGLTAGWTEVSLDMELDLGPGDFVFDGDLAPPAKKASPTQFLANVYCG